MELAQVLTVLATGAGIGAVLSFLLERLNIFQSLSARGKAILVAVLCLVLPLVGWGGQLVMGYAVPPATWQGWVEAAFSELVVGFTAWAASQGVHYWETEQRAKRGFWDGCANVTEPGE